MKPQRKEKNKKSKGYLVILGIIILLFIISIVFFFVFLNKKNDNQNNVTYDNIDNYDNVSVNIDNIDKNGVIFSDFYYKTSKDAQVLYIKAKNNTDTDITESRKYQISVIGSVPLNDAMEVFYIDDLKAGEEEVISISLSNIVSNVTQIFIDEF